MNFYQRVWGHVEPNPWDRGNTAQRHTERIEKYAHLNKVWFAESTDLKHVLARFIYYHRRLYKAIEWVCCKLNCYRWIMRLDSTAVEL